MMTARHGYTDILAADVEAIVNPVNTVGVMDDGLAAQFKERYPANYNFYLAAHKAGMLQLGSMLTYDRGPGHRPRYLINFPTKRHWKNPSRTEYIHCGLTALVNTIHTYGIRSLALPALGCGLGGLSWLHIKPLITRAFADTPDVRVVLFSPQES